MLKKQVMGWAVLANGYLHHVCLGKKPKFIELNYPDKIELVPCIISYKPSVKGK